MPAPMPCEEAAASFSISTRSPNTCSRSRRRVWREDLRVANSANTPRSAGSRLMRMTRRWRPGSRARATCERRAGPRPRPSGQTAKLRRHLRPYVRAARPKDGADPRWNDDSSAQPCPASWRRRASRCRATVVLPKPASPSSNTALPAGSSTTRRWAASRITSAGELERRRAASGRKFSAGVGPVCRCQAPSCSLTRPAAVSISHSSPCAKLTRLRSMSVPVRVRSSASIS